MWEDGSRRLQDGRFELIRLLGQGGSAVVFEIYDHELGVSRALKSLNRNRTADAVSRARFLQEARIMANQARKYAVTIHDIFTEDEQMHLVLELCLGNLSDWVQVHGPMTTQHALQVMLPVCAALQIAHESEIIHRDVKPHNILISQDGQIKLSDFGTAQTRKGLDENTRTGELLGSLAFMAPEQLRDSHEISNCVDIYALGATYLWMTLQKIPVDLHFAESPKEFLRDYPAPIRALILNLLDRNPKQRPQSLVQVSEQIQKLIEPETQPLDLTEGLPISHHGVLPTVQPLRSTAPTRRKLSQRLRYAAQQPFLRNLSVLFFVMLGVLSSLYAQSISEEPTIEIIPLCDGVERRTVPGRSLRAGIEVSEVTYADLDRDGDQDLIVSHAGEPRVGLYYNLGDEDFQEPTYIPALPSKIAPIVLDINHDKLIDLLVIDTEAEQGVLLLQKQNNVFEPTSRFSASLFGEHSAFLTSNVDGDFLFVTGDTNNLRVISLNVSQFSVKTVREIKTKNPISDVVVAKLYPNRNPVILTAHHDGIIVHEAESLRPLDDFPTDSIRMRNEYLNVRSRDLSIAVANLDSDIETEEIYLAYRIYANSLLRFRHKTSGIEGCRLPRSAYNGVPERRFEPGVSDLNQDGLLDRILVHTCPGCVSRVQVRWGRNTIDSFNEVNIQ